VGGRRRWVVGAGGWSAQLSGNRPFFWGEWSTQLGGQRSWVVGAAGWSAQVDGRGSWVIIDLFSEVRARLQQVLARIGASEVVSEVFLPDPASGCQSNRRVVLRKPKWCQNINTLNKFKTLLQSSSFLLSILFILLSIFFLLLSIFSCQNFDNSELLRVQDLIWSS
jgi:hypothetical protein